MRASTADGDQESEQPSARPARRRGPRPAGSATISRVAEAAGVSRATVSRVMNGSTTVAAELAARVRAAAAALDYEPSVAARSLALGRTGTISLVVPDLSNPLYQGVLRGLGQAAAETGRRLLVAESNEDPEEETVLALEARRNSDGLVLASPRAPDERLRELGARLSPFVLVYREVPGCGAPSLSVDNAAGVADLVAHLTGLGHRHLVYLAGPPGSAANSERLAALRAAPGLTLTELPCGSMFDDGHAAAPAVVECGASAVVGFNDMVASGALTGLHELGVRVPADISVTGFDDIPFARYTTPPLTTVSIPKNELGRQAWDRLRALMEGEGGGYDVRFQPRLLVRDSTGPRHEAPRPREEQDGLDQR
ncbi:LacI family DNA-binding transcriptional regulator [Nonomuraea jiangxiensis]|uniref:LacI family transcriptional regulator n=1 Tax=Nonomuraea jiangxiensis TaxID=633440 RepID=A0A1G8T5P0_9ACTN|nr:LacI family DNA-binding transcriptional regulator [Nonomuraea jiangxiensis]SDJ36793.1 LacI family transcriptional regulator [Nonomuraea jiangxiensis]